MAEVPYADEAIPVNWHPLAGPRPTGPDARPLKHLELDETAIVDLSPLDLTYSKLPKGELARLRTRLPKCRISHAKPVMMSCIPD